MEVDWHSVGSVGIYSLAGFLCLIAFVLSCLSLSGTWVVLGATGLVAWSRWPAFPGIGTLVVFLLLCIAVEVIEGLAGAWGVQKRGGSKAAGWAALGGGFLGMMLGGFIPVPVIGSLLGMIAGSFGCAFLVEHAKMKKAGHAAHVATGAVLARLGVIFLKVGVTLAMTFALAIGIAVT
ncbi:DUF456 domain-containing protein [Pontiella sulfatireligans]|uniref:DUF456 domain-containing protein n=1 Tax=Pontiella sulfatireligans TaxID=2750658 RepID=A0A6C2URW3_9BACT|nr:DUF456 domain-containing protein [Pontiella sulfatireligans]VGO23072.1 hypothetical protein SCARR_05171 [Pontiella sulfatireligans]